MLNPLRVYADGLTTRGSHTGGDPIILRLSNGTVAPLELSRWLGPADETDEHLLSTISGPVLDVGCGPGRHLHALAKRGVFALGVDLSPVAVDLARGRGGRAIVGSIFDELPGAGTWRTALLLDGNIGIGGEPERLLTRVGALLRTRGHVLVELDPPGCATTTLTARLERGREVSHWFRWARVSFDDIELVAHAAGYDALDRWEHGNRWFAQLRLRSP
jgi:SAM-dependent methyltransferase